jgi:hypothetical protein
MCIRGPFGVGLVVFAASNSFAAATGEKEMEFGVNAGVDLLLSPSS